jgi:hypothetical protein
VEFYRLNTLTSQECRDLGVPDEYWFTARPLKAAEEYNPNRHLAWAISLFRMRVRLIHDVDALIVVGGKEGESWGRFPGIAEEVMLAIAMNKPVYVLGGSPAQPGGAAREVGRLLGMGAVIANPDTCFRDVSPIGPALDRKYADSFALPGHPDLPKTLSELRSYLFQRYPGSEGWTWNGLTPSQNRALFCEDTSGSTDHEPIVDLILKGLDRLTWKEDRDGMSASRPASIVEDGRRVRHDRLG